MISTLFLLQLLAFRLWYLASPQAKLQPVGYAAYALQNPQQARAVGTLLAAATAVALGMHWGWMTGLSAWLVGLMGVGGLVVALAPFRYFGVYSVLALYGVFLGLEILF
ncbi:hypothetical protein [Solirubrum puertoriconensis]|uniref:Uncharacterized protein n=1 Tax=Solirubrum puertoriconensis TaxID=1751427 RepID=A0A9X0HNJ0_SOLP1|nr:hypothetical protein [Solirubrum puertoriconensis]KUG09162.1 hypothetical protein ASU33_20310 [Solirubrum puertoriconensis]